MLRLKNLLYVRKASIRARAQDIYFGISKSELGGHPDPLSLLPKVYQPNFELDNYPTELVAIFYESPSPNVVNFHLVFRDEVIPYSKRLDEEYREFRKEQLGRTTDVESMGVRIGPGGVPYLRLPFNYSFTPVYLGSLHYTALGVPWVTGRLYTSSINHMLDQTGRYLSPVIRLYGGYRQVEPAVVREGTREEAGKFVP